MRNYEIEVERDEFAEQNADSSEKQAKLVIVLNNYSLFLTNADELLAKFRQDKVFYNELKIFNSSSHPERIKYAPLILSGLKTYFYLKIITKCYQIWNA
jgi:hypothetical protein